MAEQVGSLQNLGDVANITKYFRNSMNGSVYSFNPTDILQSSLYLKINPQYLHCGRLYVKLTLLKGLGLFLIFNINFKEFNRQLAALSFKKPTTKKNSLFLYQECISLLEYLEESVLIVFDLYESVVMSQINWLKRQGGSARVAGSIGLRII